MVTTYVHFTGKRFSLVIQTLAAAVSLGKGKKVLYPYFSFVIMAVNCCIDDIIDEFLA